AAACYKSPSVFPWRRMKMRRSFYFIFALLASAVLSWIVPAHAQTGHQQVHIKVYAFNRKTGDAVRSERVYFQQSRTAGCPTGAAASAETGGDGVADIYVDACIGSADLFLNAPTFRF